MLPSASRLRRNSDFARVYGKGRSYATDLVVVYMLPNGRCESRIGFVVSKKLGGAVVRNRTKRLLRESARQVLPGISAGCDLVVVARRKAAGASLAELSGAVYSLFRKFGILNAHIDEGN